MVKSLRQQQTFAGHIEQTEYYNQIVCDTDVNKVKE